MAARGHDLALVARSEPALDALANELTRLGQRPFVMALDLARADAAGLLADELRKSDISVEILVNNAGYGLAGQVADLDAQNQLGMVDLNIRALTELTLTFLPQVRAHRGRILNIASIAAFMPGPGMAVYYASKAFVLSFSQALAQELRGEGVSVTALCPGPVATGFQARAGMNFALLKIYRPVSSSFIARAGYRAMMRGQRVAVPGWMNKLMMWSLIFTPKALTVQIVGAVQSSRRKG